MKNVLVTGASGLIGRKACSGLLKKGYNVIATDSEPPASAPSSDNYKFISASPDDKNAFTKIFEDEGIDALIHLACTVDNDFDNIIDTPQMDLSARCNKFIFKMAASAKVDHCVMISTSQIYETPKSREPLNEEDNIKPLNNYSKMKYETEKQFGLDLGSARDMVRAILRVAPVYTRDYYHNLYSKVYDPKDNTNFVYRTGEYGFHFCCVHNLVDFILCLLRQNDPKMYTGVYNIADKNLISAYEIINFMGEFHRIGAVFQRNEPGKNAIKSLFSKFGSSPKEEKTDYRYLDTSVILNNISINTAKASRICPFRWNLENTK